MADEMRRIFFNKFQGQTSYSRGATYEPIGEWPMELLDYNHPLAHEGCVLPPNDVYGKMFYYLRDLCVIFQYRLRKLKSLCFSLNGGGLLDYAKYTYDTSGCYPVYDLIEV